MVCNIFFYYWICFVILSGVLGSTHVSAFPGTFFKSSAEASAVQVTFTPSKSSHTHKAITISLGRVVSKLVPADSKQPEVGESTAFSIEFVLESGDRKKLLQIDGAPIKDGKNILGESREINIKGLGLTLQVHDIEWDPTLTRLVSLSFKILE